MKQPECASHHIINCFGDKARAERCWNYLLSLATTACGTPLPCSSPTACTYAAATCAPGTPAHPSSSNPSTLQLLLAQLLRWPSAVVLCGPPAAEQKIWEPPLCTPSLGQHLPGCAAAGHLLCTKLAPILSPSSLTVGR